MKAKNYQLRKDLKIALKNHQLVLYYQPQYDSTNNRLVSAEALVRWQRDSEIISPGEFLKFVDSPELLADIDWYILRQVCDFLRSLMRDGIHVVPIAVNFSQVHKDHPGFCEKLCSVVDFCGIPHNLIVVEIQESFVSEYSDGLVELIKSINEAGFPIAIDDFGRGTHSLPLLRDIPADILKIDNSLYTYNCKTSKERAIIASIVDLAHHLGMTTIAEGVENKETLNYLRECGCEMVQGYLFSKPVPQGMFENMLCQNTVTDIPDILTVHSDVSAKMLLNDAMFGVFPMILMANITRNSYYTLNREKFTIEDCPNMGTYDSFISTMAGTLHPDDQEAFTNTFSVGMQLVSFYRGEQIVRMNARQRTEDGSYRDIELFNVFVKNPSVEDILVVTMIHY